jgi:plasmid stability protein
MEQLIALKIDDDTAAAYKAVADAHGRSLEAELREVIETNRPKKRKSRDELIALSESLRAGQKMGADSTPYIRWARDTNCGKLDGSTYQEPDAGR